MLNIKWEMLGSSKNIFTSYLKGKEMNFKIFTEDKRSSGIWVVQENTNLVSNNFKEVSSSTSTEYQQTKDKL